MTRRRDQAGAFVTDWRDFTVEAARLAFSHGLRWVVLHVHEGERDPEPYGLPPISYVDAIRRTNLEVGAWGSISADNPAKRPASSARQAHVACAALSASFYVANIEIEYDDEAFLRMWRSLRPSFTTWLSSGLMDPRDWAAWFKKGAIVPNYPVATVWAPQCYVNVNPPATPMEALFVATRPGGHGIRPDDVRPTIGCYDPPDSPRVPADQYVDELVETGRPGFSIYHATSTTPAEYATFGRAIIERKVALI